MYIIYWVLAYYKIVILYLSFISLMRCNKEGGRERERGGIHHRECLECVPPLILTSCSHEQSHCEE